jgi:sulfite reductase alpha subunit-like flavoprotein
MEGTRRLAILYGSETGTAEQEARMLYLQCKERGFQVEVSSLDDYPLEDIPEIDLAVFLVSTTGTRQLTQARETPRRT